MINKHYSTFLISITSISEGVKLRGLAYQSCSERRWERVRGWRGGCRQCGDARSDHDGQETMVGRSSSHIDD